MLDTKDKRGFSLIEMVVVMSIIAVLGLLGLPAMLKARNQAILDSTVEKTVSIIREAQNRSISFAKSSKAEAIGKEAKFYSAEISSSGISLNAYYSGTPAFGSVDEHNPWALPTGTTLSVGYTEIYFVPPFGNSFIFSSPCNYWQKSAKPSKEYEPINGSCVSPVGNVDIQFSYKGMTRTVRINEKGDVRVE